MSENRLANIDVKRFQKAVEEFIEAQRIKKENDATFAQAKNKFSKAADVYFELKGDNASERINLTNNSVIVSQVRKVDIQWDLSKLKKTLSKQTYKEVINKSYEIIDFKGLSKYLKEFGVDPEVFRTFLSVSEKVDEKTLDQKEQLGEVNFEELKNNKCFSTICQKSYYQLRIKNK